MKETIFRYAKSIRVRIISAFLAVLIIFAGLPYVGIETSATPTPGDGVVVARSTYSKYLGTVSGHRTSHDSLGDDNGTYTGKILPVTVNMYDYLTDAEINTPATWNNLSDSSYTYYNRYNPYDKFNKEISNNNTLTATKTVSMYTENITFIYDPNGTAGSSDDMYVYLFNSSTDANYHSFPGDRMEKGADGKFKITIKASDLGGSVYDRIIFCNVYDYSNSSKWQTQTMTLSVSQAVSSGKSYTYKRTSWDSTNSQAIIQKQSDGTADAITTKQQAPLYLGNFLSRISNAPTSDPHSSNNTNGKNNDAPNSYDSGVKSKISPTLNSGSYNNFFWQANISQRPISVDSQKSNRPKAVVQGLVDNTLNDDGLVAQNDVALPYFDSDWSGAADAKGYMKCWESTEANPISFPFYELLQETATSGQYARYYQFNSRDSTLLFHEADEDHLSAYFEEKESAVNYETPYSNGTVSGSNRNDSIRAATKKVGYFPFNSTDSWLYKDGGSGHNNNYGFGTMFQMTFKLKPDGKVDAVDSNGDTIRSDAQKVDTLFEFAGDDDLWVFIDDNLVLDMGGSHAASTGQINFASGTATVDNAITYGTGGVDNLGIVGSSKTVDIKSLLNRGYISSETAAADPTNAAMHVQGDINKPLRSGYDPEEVHTMKIFYMERGMSESNLFIRFNFPAEPNYSKLKVKEQTDFSEINAGLKDLTKKAADVDVFRYLIENQGTTNDDVLKINAVYPTKENYIRSVNNGTPTKLTSSTTSSPEQKSYYFKPDDISGSGFKRVAGVSYNWVDERALKDGTGDPMKSKENVGGITSSAESPSTDNGYMYLMYGTPDEGAADEIKSSGEFEGQFARYSLLKVTQDNDLYTPNTHATNGAAAELNTTRYTTPRTVSEYYNETERYIFSSINTNDTFNITNGQAFNFRNNIVATSTGAGGYTYLSGDSTTNKDANELSPVAMTAQFVNAPKTGALSITKTMATSNNQEFTIKVRFEDIFGTDVDADVAGDYNDIVYNRYNDSDHTRDLESTLTPGTVTATGAACGTFTMKAGETVTIENIPYKTKFTVYEEMDGFTPSYSTQTGTISEGVINVSHKAETLTGTEITNNNITVTNTPVDENTLKIKEITSFLGVNSGLLSYTKKAAEDDVFKYTVSNQGTANGDVSSSGIIMPTYDTWVRTNSEAAAGTPTTNLTCRTLYLDTLMNNGASWSQDSKATGGYRQIIAFFGKGDNWWSTRKTYLGNRIGDNLYVFNNIPIDYTHVKIIRVSRGHELSAFIDGTLQTQPTYSNSIEFNDFSIGDTYRVTEWSTSPASDNGKGCACEFEEDGYSTHDYTPGASPSGFVAVANTNYLWDGGFDAKTDHVNGNPLAGTTDTTGSFYLMYGADSTKGSTNTSESSALFLKQFKKPSTMKVVQSNILTTPVRNSNVAATLSGTSTRTVNGFYNKSVELDGSTDSEPTNDTFAYNKTGTGAVEIVETFTNTVKVGGIKVTKTLSNSDTATDSFTFQLTLNTVFGGSNNSVAFNGYNGISAIVNGTLTTLSSTGTFSLQGGQEAIIKGIPVGTTYTITETVSGDNYTVSSPATGTINGEVKEGVLISPATTYDDWDNYNVHGDNIHTFTNTRNKGTLRLSKNVQGGGNAPSGSTDSYIFKVTLKEPAGVTFNGNYTIGGLNYSDSGVDYTNKTYTFYKTITSPSYSLEITDIPYGTEYTVEEVYLSGGNYLPVDGAANMQPVINPSDGTISDPQTVANVTNTYRKVVLTKKDSADSSKGVNGATYYLLKLKDGVNESNSAAVTAFANAAHYNDAGITQYYSSCSSTSHTTNNGTITIRDTDMTNGLTPGNYFFFEESAPSTGYYLRDNTLSDTKIINIPATPATPTDENLSFSITYTDERKKGSLELEKLLAAGTDSKYSAGGSDEQSFTFYVELNGADADGNDDHINLNNYSITGFDATPSYNSSTYVMSGTVTVIAGESPLKKIQNIPYGTKYTVTESNILNGWKQTATQNVTGTISDSSTDTVTKKATIKNGKVGSLTLKKTTSGNNSGAPANFTFTGKLSAPSGVDLTAYGITGATLSNYQDSNRTCDFNVSVPKDNATGVTISNIPYGTTYTVDEYSVPDGVVRTISGDGGTTGTGTIDSTKDVHTVTINNEYTVSLVLKKTVTGTNPPDSTFTFDVTLTGSFSGYTIKKNSETITPTSGTAFQVSIRAGDENAVTISGLPYNVGYSIDETTLPDDWEKTTSTPISGTITNPATQTINNKYTPPVRTLTLLKVDPSKDNAVIKSDSASFILLRLPDGFDPNNADSLNQLRTEISGGRTSVQNYVGEGNYFPQNGTATFDTANGQLTITEGTTSNFESCTFGTTNWYFFYETEAPQNYNINNTVTVDKIFKFESDEYTKFVAYPNLPTSTPVDVLKKDKDTNALLSGAEFELWYRDTRNPSTYSINSPVISPNLTSTKSLTSSTAPEPTAISNSETIEITNYDYNAVSAPSASESQWILPRSDNDYIYFRDYNTGSSQFSEDSNGSWISYSLGNNDYGQSSELIYDTSKWLKAKFTATGKPSVEYAVWERFVDKYDGKDTVVWKIQPPDGYTNVEFILCQGNNHIRNTESFKYVLGNIYTKTNKGKYDGGKYGYPVKGEHWSTNWNGTGETNSDNRMTYPNDYDVNGVSASSVNTTKYVFSGATSTSGQTAPKQTERYVPTPQKIVFHCNSNKVWHNIHIEFFSDSSGTTHVGQGFPGYMMEPYAYAGSDYRINGYLTYELTIPDGATHFRINDGVKIDQTYGYYTKITSLGDLTDNKNKYFKIKSNNDSQKDITLIPSTSFATNAGKTFTDNNAIESDGDYVYFAAPSSWGNVYAYFYGGGNLREDNWQRACYSIWPGVAPVGSKFDDGTDHDSTIYIYSATANPDTTFEIKKGSETYRVYKFRVPLGETKNYSKVIFNNGLSHSGGSKETSAISYQAGYIYYPNGSSQKQYDNKPTYTYTDRGDNLYVRMTSTDLEKWDDLHVTFYNSSGTPILQSSSGYVMKYSGTDGTYTYFTIPIPANASKFSINNGNNKSSPHNVSDSSKYDILPYNKDATQEDINTAHGTFTKGGMLYTLSGNTLTTPATAPTFTDSGSTQTTTSSTPYPSPRGDYIYIKDADGTGFSGTPTFTFYNGDTPIDTSGLNLKVNTHAVEGSTKWYSVGIPTNATKFTINNGSTKYDIYPRSSGSDGEYTPGGMYYNATSSTELSLLWPTFTSSGVDTIYHEDDWDTDARGDTLYLVYDTIPTGGIVSVTFKNSSGSIIKKGTEDSIKATYIGQLTSETPEVAGVSTSESNAVGHWFKVNIPNNAATFTATANSQSVTDEIYKLRRTPARYHKDYTLDGMQYHIKDTTATRFYPVFTEDTVYTQQVGDQTLDTTSGVILVDETQILSAYYNSVVGPSYTAITSTNASDGDGYVLHATSSDTITYTWQEGTGGSSDYIYFDNSLTGWSTVYVYFYKDGNDTTYNSGWTNETNKMASPGSGETYYKFDVTSLGDALSNYDRVIFHTKVGDSDYSTYQTNNATYTVGSLYTPNINSSNNNRIYLHNNGYNGGYPNHDNSNIRGYFTSDNWSSNWNGNGNSGWGNQGDRTWSLSDIGTSNTKAKFQIDGESETNEVNLVNGGKGQVFKLNSYTSVEFEGYLTSSNTVENKISLTVTTPTTTTVYSSQFQPEDRYGYISDVTSMNDSDGKHNNFVKVVDEYNDGGTTKHYLTDPHILFYSDNGITEINTAVSGTTQNSHGIKLNPDVVSNTYPNIDGTQYTAYGSGTAADPYLVRLPKGAKYAKIFDGDTQVGDIVSLTDTYGKTGGVTLNVTSDSSVLSVSAESALRGGTAIQNGKKKTDYDYVYFTDTGSTTLGGNIHAYYFGDTDGEFAAWPGVAPSYSYTDNSGNTVYAFLYPTLENSSAKAYPYVMFNSGAAYGSGTITEAYPYANGVNYKIDTSATPDLTYGTSSSSVKHLTTAQAAKATETVNFTTSNTNGKYLFFINNGPKNLATANLEGTHTPLDDVHITFYSDEAGTTAVGNGNAGYVMDNTGETYSGTGTGGTVYRIAIPDGARYFSINNGTGKGTDTQVHDRRSVVTKISQNGLYKFVDSATVIGKDGNTNITPSEVKDYWNSTDVPVDSNALNSHEYYLELVNKRSINEEEEDIPETETYEVHLATVVTGSDGQIEKITWLKLNDSGTEVDQTYLDHTKADIYNPDTDSPKNIKVKILKDGTYYWIETKAPNNYNIDDPNPRTFTKSTNETTGVVTLSNSGTETFEDTEKPTPTGASVLFTKTAKEQVGSYGIGEALPGAKFKLVDVNSPTTVFNFTATVEGGLNVYTKSTSGTTELVTNSSGQFKLVNIPIGDYYLEETEAPSGFNNKESDGTTNRKVYFSVGENNMTAPKAVTMSDEMVPAYIKLYEHINEKLPAWGDPTFIFKITKSGGKTSYVALTVDDNGTLDDNVLTGSVTSKTFTGWKVESTDEIEEGKCEYQGMYHIDSQGRIRVEPGEYTITRIPVSRYEFVTAAKTDAYTGTTAGTQKENKDGSDKPLETVTITDLTAGKTVDVHYYDEVKYYDKFSHVDEEINKFYTLDASKNNITAKGIRVEYNGKVATDPSTATIITNNTNNTTANSNTFNAWFINVDGTERAMTAEEKEKLVITVPNELSADFTYSDTSHQLSISNTLSHANNVYTLTATYDSKFTTTFDLVFARS